MKMATGQLDNTISKASVRVDKDGILQAQNKSGEHQQGSSKKTKLDRQQAANSDLSTQMRSDHVNQRSQPWQ